MSAPVLERWDDRTSNRQQRYLTHGIFRYFGKLPPTVTARILAELQTGPRSHVVDVMCGSGTTLLEAVLAGARRATGVDCNDLSLLIAAVKTTPVDLAAVQRLRARFRRDASRADLPAREALDVSHLPALDLETGPPPAIRNLAHWFPALSVSLMCWVRDWVGRMKPGPLKDLATVAFLGTVRPCSRASVRIGRLFCDRDKQVPSPLLAFERRLEVVSQAVASLPQDPRWRSDRVRLQLGDARATGLRKASADVVFCHPPYFALYRYSSDVLRFELEWWGRDRKAIRRREIEEGFKTTDETLVTEHLADMGRVAGEAYRIARPKARFVIVTANSTLRKEPLAVIEPLIRLTESHGWHLERHAVRAVRFAQASYHRSADAAIQRPEDEVLVFARG